MDSNEELEAFKRLPINGVAAAFGFRIVPRKSSRHSALMVGPAGDKIICATSRIDGHGVFCSTAGDASGSAIDLAIAFGGAAGLGHARQLLRPLLTPGALPADTEHCGGDLRPTAPDLLGVLARYARYEIVESEEPYLCGERKIPGAVLLSERFAGRVRHDPDRGGVVFPHYGSPDGSQDRVLTGYEIRGVDLNVFSKGGRKGLWPSNAFERDERLAVCESSIDALSYAALRVRDDVTRFVSIGGQLNPEQPTLIASAIAKLPRGEVVLAVDNDEGGDRIAEKLSVLFQQAGRSDLTLRVDVPPLRGQDWNQLLVEASP